MSYTPINWQTGDTITAEKLNKMDSRWEDFIVTLTPTSQDMSGTMNKSPSEITEAYNAGKNVKFSITMSNIETIVYPVNVSLIPYGQDYEAQFTALFTYTPASTTYLIRAYNNVSSSTYGVAMFPLN